MPNESQALTLKEHINSLQTRIKAEEIKSSDELSPEYAALIKRDILTYVENCDSSARGLRYEIERGYLRLLTIKDDSVSTYRATSSASRNKCININNYTLYHAISNFLSREGLLTSGSWDPKLRSGHIDVRW